MFDLVGKSILITGATGYIGSQLATSLAALGAHIHVNSRNRARCEALVSLIQANGGTASVASFDVTQQDEIKAFAASVERMDVLVNNAYTGKGGTVESAAPEDYVSSYNSSVVASATLTKCLLPAFRRSVSQQGDASIINIASMYGVVSPDPRIYASASETNPPYYGSAKAALIQWTKYAACEFAKERIRVNCISPGPFPSSATQTNAPELVQRIIAKCPMGRVGQPSELVGPVVFLASSASSYVTGINLSVDGGWTSW